jgi:hypothetical protein
MLDLEQHVFWKLLNDFMNDFSIVIGIVVVIITAFVLGFYFSRASMKMESINRGVGYYNPTNGQFQFKTWPTNDFK